MEQVRTDLRAAVLEHVMRIADDELSLLPFVSAEPCSAEALAALGRLLSEVAVPLDADAPLAVFCGGGSLDERWRDSHQARPGSLWQSFQMLEALYGPAETSDPYDAYCLLRTLSEDDLAQP